MLLLVFTVWGFNDILYYNNGSLYIKAGSIKKYLMKKLFTVGRKAELVLWMQLKIKVCEYQVQEYQGSRRQLDRLMPMKDEKMESAVNQAQKIIWPAFESNDFLLGETGLLRKEKVTSFATRN